MPNILINNFLRPAILITTPSMFDINWVLQSAHSLKLHNSSSIGWPRPHAATQLDQVARKRPEIAPETQ